MERAGGLEGQFRWVVEGCWARLWCFLEMCAHEEVRLEVRAIDYFAERGQVQACQLFFSAIKHDVPGGEMAMPLCL